MSAAAVAPTSSSPAIRIGADERVLVIGASGSGKSVLVQAITSRWSRGLWIDTKDEVNLPNARVVTSAREAVRALPGRVVWRPAWDELTAGGTGGTAVVRPDVTDYVLRRMWELGGHGLGVHELGDVADQNRTPIMLGAVFRKGRARGIPAVVATQAPKGIPMVVRREASHVFVFALQLEEDRVYVASFTGEAVRAPLPLPFDYTFWHRGPDGIVRRLPRLTLGR